MNEAAQKVLILAPFSAPGALDFFAVDLPFETHCLRIKDNIPTYICPSISRATQMMSAFDGRFHIVAFGQACRYVAEAIELRAITGDRKFGAVVLIEPHLNSNYEFDLKGVERLVVLNNTDNVLAQLSSPWAGMGKDGAKQLGVVSHSYDSLNMMGGRISQYNALTKTNIAQFKTFIVNTIQPDLNWSKP